MTHSADWDCHCQSLSTVRLSGPVPHPRTPRTPRIRRISKNQNHKNVGDQRGDADEKSLRSHTPLTPLLLHGTTVSPRQHTPACGPRPRRSQKRCCARQRLKAELSPPRPVPSWLPPVAVGAGPPARFGNFPFGGGACSRSRGQPSVQAGWLRGHTDTSRALGCENGSATRLISQTLIHMDVLSNNKPFCPD